MSPTSQHTHLQVSNLILAFNFFEVCEHIRSAPEGMRNIETFSLSPPRVVECNAFHIKIIKTELLRNVRIESRPASAFRLSSLPWMNFLPLARRHKQECPFILGSIPTLEVYEASSADPAGPEQTSNIHQLFQTRAMCSGPCVLIFP